LDRVNFLAYDVTLSAYIMEIVQP